MQGTGIGSGSLGTPACIPGSESDEQSEGMLFADVQSFASGEDGPLATESAVTKALRWWAVLAVPLLTPAVAAGFTPGEVYWAPGSCSGPCGFFDVTGGGDRQGASPLAVIDRSPGQIAWRGMPLAGYLTQFASNAVVRVGANGAVNTFAVGIDGATGLLATRGGRLLAVSFDDGAVYDISAGGDQSAATPFASGFDSPRNLLELATGQILLADQSSLGRAVYDITAGGDFSSATPFAWGFPPDGPYDLVQNGAGRIFASTDAGVFDITGGGSFASATPHASGRNFVGLAVDGAGRLLALELESDMIYDITAGGDYAAAAPFAWNLDGFGDSALDTVPALAPPAVPSLGSNGVGLLSGLLSLLGAARLRGAARSPRPPRSPRRRSDREGCAPTR